MPRKNGPRKKSAGRAKTVSGREVVIVLGYPGAGKTSVTEEFAGYERINRDDRGGLLAALGPALDRALAEGNKSYILDNTFPTVESRKPILVAAKKHRVPVRCIHLTTSIEDAQVNAICRMVQRYGKMLTPDEIAERSKADPNMFPPAVLFGYRNRFEEPTKSEGFASLEEREFVRRIGPSYKNKALFFDLDGTVRDTKSGEKYPTDPADVVLMKNSLKVLADYHNRGYKLIAVSNQGDVGTGKVTLEAVDSCMQRTKKLIGLPMELFYCPHNPRPIQCYCRKPMPGFGVQAIELHKLDRAQCIMVGDRTSDRTFATRCGIESYFDHAEFFKR